MARPARPGARDALLEAAREEFARRGLEGARVEDIARRAGMSKGAFYLHFRTKEDAFREIVQRLLGALEDHACRRGEVEERIARAPPSPANPEAAARALDAECAIDADLLELLWRHREIVAAVESAADRSYRDLIADFRRRMLALIARRIEERQRAGAVRADVDPQVAADVVTGAYEVFSRRMVDMPERPDIAAWARSVLLVLYEGLLPRAAGESVPPPGRARLDGARRARGDRF